MGTTFTTEPSTRRHVENFASYKRAVAFMERLWQVKLRKCLSYGTLRYEFECFFGSNEDRTVFRYLGRLESIERYSGASVVRQNRQSGTVAHFLYTNQRFIEAKVGLLERLGFIDLNKKTGKVTVHHERLEYYTEQSNLESPNDTQEMKERVDCSNDKVCVSSLGTNCNTSLFQPMGRARETALGTGVSPLEATERKEEEDIDGTRTRRLWKKRACLLAHLHGDSCLTAEKFPIEQSGKKRRSNLLQWVCPAQPLQTALCLEKVEATNLHD